MIWVLPQIPQLFIINSFIINILRGLRPGNKLAKDKAIDLANMIKSETQTHSNQLLSASLLNQEELNEINKYIESSFSEMENLGIRKQQTKIEGFEMNEIKMSGPGVYPFEYDPTTYFDQMLSSGVLKPFETRGIEENFNAWIKDKRQLKMAFLLFWIVFAMKFPNNVDGNIGKLLNYLRKKIGKNYVKFFALLPKPKEELMNLMIFTAGYVTQLAYFYIFPRDRAQFKLRFILDIYHIAVFELNGIYVSDFYVQANFEKVFTSKFLDYERNQNQPGRSGLQKSKTGHAGAGGPNPFHKGHQGDKVFLGKKLNYPNLMNVEGGLEFADELATYLRFPHNKSKKLMSQFTGIPRNANNESHNLQVPKSDNFAEHVKTTETKINIEENERIRNILRSEDVSTVQNTETLKKSTDAGNELGFDEVDENKNSAKEILSGRLKFNCIQISPTVSQVLSNPSMTLPFKKKKVINHSIDRLEGQNVDYREVIENIKIEKQKNKDFKPAVRTKTHVKSLTGHYNVKMEYSDKAKKYPNLFQDMEDMHEILRIHDSRFTQLHSSVQTLHNQADRRMRLSFIRKSLEKENTQSARPKHQVEIIDETISLNQTMDSNVTKLPPIRMGHNAHERAASYATASTLENSLVLTGPLTVGAATGKKKTAKFFASPIDGQDETGNSQQQINNETTQDNRSTLPTLFTENASLYKKDEKEVPSRFKEEEQFKYKDLRKNYIDKYHPIINRNPDENINSLVQNILSKQNILKKNLGKIVKANPKLKGKV